MEDEFLNPIQLCLQDQLFCMLDPGRFNLRFLMNKDKNNGDRRKNDIAMARIKK